MFKRLDQHFYRPFSDAKFISHDVQDSGKSNRAKLDIYRQTEGFRKKKIESGPKNCKFQFENAIGNMNIITSNNSIFHFSY